MKAIQFKSFGEPTAVLEIIEKAIPEPQADEIQVKMLLRPINPYELQIVRGQYSFKPNLPDIPGFEGIGVVQKLGSAVQNIQVGQKVLAMALAGTWQEVVIGKAGSFLPLPGNIQDESAALIANPLTCYILLKEIFNIKKGDWLLDTASTTHIGRLLIQYSILFDFNLISVVRNADQAEELAQLGAKNIINLEQDTIAAAVPKFNPGGIDFVLESLGGENGGAAINTLKFGGKAVLFSKLSKQNLSIDPSIMIGKMLTLIGYTSLYWFKQSTPEKKYEVISSTLSLLAQEKIVPPVEAIYPFEDFKVAIAHSEKSGKKGKVLLKSSVS
ncbi:MAG: zinc-dependent alcohol dehydrogenase family protein [Bacteroidota bacterium]